MTAQPPAAPDARPGAGGLPFDPALEALVRPLLALLCDVTGLEAACLTSVDAGNGREWVLLARDGGALGIGEGRELPRCDARGSPEAGPAAGPDASPVRSDRGAAHVPGIRSHACRPVRIGDGRVRGMLHVAGSRSGDVDATAQRVLEMASRLVALHVERQALAAALRRRDDELASSAVTDPVTGLPNRRALEPELGRMLARAQRDGMAVFAAVVDSDHATGRHDPDDRERQLRALAARLADGLRGGDLVARCGDRFVVVGAVPRETAEASAEVVRSRLSAQAEPASPQPGGGASVGLVVSRVGDFDAEALLARADAALPANARARAPEA